MLKLDKILEMKRFALEIRRNILKSIAAIGSGHVGGSLSIADAFAVLYSGVMNVDPKRPRWPDRDYIVMSKGHAGPVMYATLALKGYFPIEMLETLNQNGTMLPSHTDRNKTSGVDMTTGSLGQGASTAAGLAFADKLDGKDRRTYLILGDGELDEGQVWESFLFVSHRQLTNLITMVDVNQKQLDGTTDMVCSLGDIAAKFEAFGYRVIDIENGNDVAQVFEALQQAQKSVDKPPVILLRTSKGAGVSLYANMANCHSCTVGDEDLNSVLTELDKTEQQLNERRAYDRKAT